MKTTFGELWKRYGNIIEVKEDIKDIDGDVMVPKGNWLILDRDQFGYELYNPVTHEFSNTEGVDLDNNFEFRIIQSDVDSLVELMYEGLTRKALILISEGWVLDSDNNKSDIDFILSKVKTLRALMGLAEKDIYGEI